MSLERLIAIVGGGSTLLAGLGFIVNFLYNLYKDRRGEIKETTQQRVEREANDRQADIKRYDEGLWKLIGKIQEDNAALREELDEVKKEVSAVNDRNQLLVSEIQNHIAEKLQMKDTIRRQGDRIVALEAQVASLEHTREEQE